MLSCINGCCTCMQCCIELVFHNHGLVQIIYHSFYISQQKKKLCFATCCTTCCTTYQSSLYFSLKFTNDGLHAITNSYTVYTSLVYILICPCIYTQLGVKQTPVTVAQINYYSRNIIIINCIQREILKFCNSTVATKAIYQKLNGESLGKSYKDCVSNSMRK